MTVNDAERRNRRVRILSETKTDDGRGGEVVAWTPVDEAPEVWASIRSQPSREFLQAGAMQNVGNCFIEMDRRTGVTIKKRIYWPLRDKTFEIVSERDSERDDYGVELECDEVDS